MECYGSYAARVTEHMEYPCRFISCFDTFILVVYYVDNSVGICRTDHMHFLRSVLFYGTEKKEKKTHEAGIF